MDLRQLRHAVALAETLNFAHGAHKVHLTQPALSRSIQRLEGELGVRLFDRDKHQVRLTPMGRRVVARSRELLQGVRNLEHEVQLMLQLELGDIRLGSGPLPCISLLAPALAALARAHPQVRVDVEMGDGRSLLPRLLEGDIEFFVADLHTHDPHPQLSVRRLPAQYGGIFCRPDHPLAGRTLPSAREMLDYGLASVEISPETQQATARALGVARFSELPLRLHSSNTALLVAVVQHSDVLLLSTHAAVRQELDSGQLRALDWAGNLPVSPQFQIVTRAGWTLSPMAAWLVERLQTEAESGQPQQALTIRGSMG